MILYVFYTSFIQAAPVVSKGAFRLGFPSHVHIRVLPPCPPTSMHLGFDMFRAVQQQCFAGVSAQASVGWTKGCGERFVSANRITQKIQK